LATVEGASALRLKAIQEGLGSSKALDHVAQWRVAGSALGQAKVEDRIEAEEDGFVAILAGGVLPDVAVEDRIAGRRDLAEEKEPALAQRVSVLANVGAKTRAGELAHVLNRIDTQAIDIG